jgi:hypothetical protein
MRAAPGIVAFSSAGLLDESDPWWPTFSTSIGVRRPRSASKASTGISASPVSRAAKPSWRSRPTTDALLMSPSGSGPAASPTPG